MKLIVITAERFFKEEALWINELMEQDGVPQPESEIPQQQDDCPNLLLHLRKPGSLAEEMEQLITGIDPRFYRQLVLHDHLHLAKKYNLGGVHLNSRNERQYNIESHYLKTCRISRSCHSLEEVVRYKECCSYVTLSPIFDSISKQGYCSAFTQDELQRAKELKIIDHKVVALGGIGSENIAQIREMGFGGAAVLGTIWKSRIPGEARINLELLVKNFK